MTQGYMTDRRVYDTESGRRLELVEELRRFNEQRAALLNNRPISAATRLPLPYTGVGGDVAPPEGWE